jgi:uncharacterized protein YyaL (SSP411 family)
VDAGDVLSRSAALPALVVGDTARRARRAAPAETGVPDGALEAAIRWLCLTHDVTGRRGSALAYHLLRGWRPAFPETTGYIIGTLLEHAARTGDEPLVTRAREMGDWEVEVQNSDGGVMTDAVASPPGRSVAFNTGMVIFGWLDLYETLGDERYLQAAARAGEWLERTQEPDGTWQGEHDYGGIPHTYCSRVDWALLRLAAASGEERFRDVAVRHLDWVLTVQHDNGWFDWCIFRTGTLPSTHALAYTMRGLLESAALTDDRRYLDAAQRTARALAGVFREHGWLPATYDRDWTPRSRSIGVTGVAQVGGVWLRLYQETGDAEFRRAGIAAVEQAAALQSRSRWRAIDGAVPGSFPIYGRYAPLQYPNWAAKFLADSLALRERILGNGR